MTVDEANQANTVGSSWRRVVSLLENDHRVSPRQRGFVILAQAQGLIGSTLLVAVPNELTREVLQTQVKEALDDALRNVFLRRNPLRDRRRHRSGARCTQSPNPPSNFPWPPTRLWS